MADFSLSQIVDKTGDIQRSYTWELLLTLPTLAEANAGDVSKDGEDLKIRCRSVSIPGRSNEVITSNYMGMEQYFPGRPRFTQPFNITFEEFSDRKVAKALYAWQQLLFNPESVQTGLAITSKTAYKAKSCTLQLLDYRGNKVTNDNKGRIEIVNAWPENVAEVALSYAENNAIQYSLSLRYDYWKYTA